MAILWNANNGYIGYIVNANNGYIVEPKLWLYCGTQIMAILWNLNNGYIVERK